MLAADLYHALDGLPDVRESVLSGFSLRDAAWQDGAFRHDEPVFSLFQDHDEGHTSSPLRYLLCVTSCTSLPTITPA